MSGLLALLDDVAGIAKVAAASVDDVVAHAAKASSKAAGAVIDDAAVTPKYVSGFEPKRELPIIWRITKGSIFNKLVILLPIALLLSLFAPWAIAPLLMIGGGYLCFEGVEKLLHWLMPHHAHGEAEEEEIGDPKHLEEAKVRGAIKTDFILSAEIMTIVLSGLPQAGLALTAASLAAAGLMITAAVYGAVALIVKLDDIGLHLARESSVGMIQALGRSMVRAMPHILRILTIVGTAAMLWVGGAIIVHGLEELGVHEPGHSIKALAETLAQGVPSMEGFVKWLVTALCDGIFGVVIGLVIVQVVGRVFRPLAGLLKSRGGHGRS